METLTENSNIINTVASNNNEASKEIESATQIIDNKINLLETEIDNLTSKGNELNKRLSDLVFGTEAFNNCIIEMNSIAKSIASRRHTQDILESKLDLVEKLTLIKLEIKESNEYKAFTELIRAKYNNIDIKHVSIEYSKRDNVFNIYADDGFKTASRVKRTYKGNVKNFKTIVKPSGASFKFTYNDQTYILPTLNEVGNILGLSDYQRKFLSNASAYNTVKTLLENKGIESMVFSDANGNYIDNIFTGAETKNNES